MTSNLAIEDIEALIDEGCTIHPSDVIRLNALGLKIEKRPDFRLATLPRVALCGGVLFVQPTIEQEIYLDNMLQVFSSNEGTKIALEAYILAHPDKDWSKRQMFPRMFALKCAYWIKKHLGKETYTKVRAAIDYCKYGMNPMDGEYPVYVTDETFDKWYYDSGEKSTSMRLYLQACTLGIASDAALRATSPQLTAMIERAFLLNDRNISQDEKEATAEYFATLSKIKEEAYARRDAKPKEEKKDVENG